jgi:hypothetical protein
MQIAPQGKALLAAQLEHMVIHVVTREVFSSQAIVAALKRDEVVPDGGGDKDFVPQFAIFFVAAVQAVLVGFANRARLTHALTPCSSEGWRTFQRRGQHFDFSTASRFSQDIRLHPSLSSEGFPAHQNYNKTGTTKHRNPI